MKKKSIERSFKTWAINLNSDEGHIFVGVGYWEPFLKLPTVASGNRHALFETRQKARIALSTIKSKSGYVAFPKAKVSRVQITIKELS